MDKPATYITRDSFGALCPVNWHAIADWINWKVHWCVELFGDDPADEAALYLRRLRRGDLTDTTCPVPVYALAPGEKPVHVRYTCSDTALSMTRDVIELELTPQEDPYSLETWQRVKKIYTRKHNTKLDLVDIVAVEPVPID